MTPNGAVAFAVIMLIAAIAAGPYGLALLAFALVAFAVLEVGAASFVALRRAALVMLPLAAFMLLVWVGLVGRAPQDIAAGIDGSRASALLYVATVAARLFVIVCLVQLVLFRFSGETPMHFVRALHAPAGAKRLIVLTLSLIETLRHSADRAHTALIAGGIITRSPSLRNMTHGWVLMQTVWLTAITTVTARVRDKWPIENTVALIDPALAGGRRSLSVGDKGWLAAALVVGVASQIVDRYGA
jgi:hypothetical protein